MPNIRRFGFVIVISCFMSASLQANPRDKAYKLFNRINGVPPTNAELDALESVVSEQGLEAAAIQAMESDYFYNLSLKRFATPWTNVDLSPRVEFTDYVATIIGMIRDDVSFDGVLSDDIIYTANDSVVSDPNSNVPAYSTDNNDHYRAIEEQRLNLKDVLERKTQSDVTGIGAPAGVITTRAFGEAYFKDGTNRRPTRFILMTYLCRDLEQMHDTTRSDFRIRKDVPRSPGGDSNLFRNNCAGCHVGMDPMSGAFAYYDFIDERLIYDNTTPADKMNRNSDVFEAGYETVDDSWMNNWLEGPNASINWKGPNSGSGAASMGRAYTSTDAFPTCMAEKVFEFVCLRNPEDSSDKNTVKELASDFQKTGFKMKSLFAKTAAHCVNE